MLSPPEFRILESGVALVAAGMGSAYALPGSIRVFVNIELRHHSIATGSSSMPLPACVADHAEVMESVRRASRSYESFRISATAFGHHLDRGPALSTADEAAGLIGQQCGTGARLLDSAVLDAVLRVRKASFFEGMADNIAGLEAVPGEAIEQHKIEDYLDRRRRSAAETRPSGDRGLGWRMGVYDAILAGVEGRIGTSQQEHDGRIVDALSHLQDLALRKFIGGGRFEQIDDDADRFMTGPGFASSGIPLSTQNSWIART